MSSDKDHLITKLVQVSIQIVLKYLSGLFMRFRTFDNEYAH